MQILFLILLGFTMQQQILYDSGKADNIGTWRVIDDGVMGGLSAGRFGANEAGHGVFSGKVSLENNGGFSSVRYYFNPLATERYSKFVMRLRGDGKQYQFRIKAAAGQYYDYVYDFVTTGQWQTFEIPFDALAPSFRGRRLNLPYYSGKQLAELGFLIGNKKAESFQLELSMIGVE